MLKSGDISEAQILPTNSFAWNEFVGPDLGKPKAKCVQVRKNIDPYTAYIAFNYANSDAIDGASEQIKTKAINASKALQHQNIRKIIRYYLNRNLFVNYSSRYITKDKAKKSPFLRNVFTSSVLKPIEGPETELTTIKALLKDGSDAFYKSDIEKLKIQEAAIKATKAWLRENINHDTIELKLLFDGTRSSETPYVNDMVDNFNKAQDVVKIKTEYTIDNNTYNQAVKNGKYDIMFGRWGPDYNSIFAYLTAFKITGGAFYNRFAAYFKDSDITDENVPDFNSFDAKMRKSENKYYSITKTDKTAAFYESVTKFQQKIVAGEKELIEPFKLAAAEVQMLYERCFNDSFTI